MAADSTERLNRYLARCGVTSRRGADALIAAGRVSVNAVVVTALGARVDPSRDRVRLDGERIVPIGANLTIALHKPANVLTTVTDPLGRPTVMDYVDVEPRLFPVGRLDFASEGLVLLTTDGDLAQRLTHPRHGHEREYRVRVSGTPGAGTLQTWRQGVFLEDGRTAPADVRVESSTGGSTWLRFVLREGRNRQIRRMVEALHHEVHRLIRVRMGPILLGDLASGRWRGLTAAELLALEQGEQTPAAPAAEEAKGGPRNRQGWARPRARPKPRRGARGSVPRTGPKPSRGRGGRR